ncbi:MAG: metallophosphoesterase family protein [Chitinophagaceae bacterium]
MIRIGLISDTHGFLDEKIFDYFKDCDEIWHAGDFGEGIINISSFEKLRMEKKIRGVYGNIDDQRIRNEFPEQLFFICEEVKVLMRHVGGSPPNYNPETRNELAIHQPQLFICGHSHILKVMYDEKINCLYMNPGAAGRHGWHKMRTIIRFVIDGKEIKNCEVIELGKR